MPKSYAVTPLLRPGKTVFSATFKNASGNRVTRSLGTADKDAARLVCQGLVSIFNSRASSIESAPVGVPSESVRLYFDVSDQQDLTTNINAEGLANMASIQAELNRFPEQARVQAFAILVDRNKIRHELENLQIQFTSVKNSLATLQAEYDALKHSLLARVAENTGNLSSLP